MSEKSRTFASEKKKRAGSKEQGAREYLANRHPPHSTTNLLPPAPKY
jgi:hypothetical protein